MDTGNLSSEKFDRLPRHAQYEIQRLARDLADAQSRLAAGPEDSDTFADPYNTTPRPLGKGTTVRFGGAGSDGTFVVKYQDGELEVTAGTGGKRLVIIPRISNSFAATLVPRSTHG
jgi:hypothetical protein